MTKTNPKVDHFIKIAQKWQAEYKQLRQIVLDSSPELTEDYKWMHPCYTLDGKNVVLMHGFKEYCALLFHKGVLLKDPKGILIQRTENVQAGRQIRFKNLREIIDQTDVLRTYIQQAIEVEKSCIKIEKKKTEDYPVPDELLARFDELPTLKEAFGNLTPGRQRAYLYYFNQARQSKTRADRVEKYIPKILDGLGMDD